MTEREQLEDGIAALESQRAVLGDAVVDTAVAALRAKLARLAEPEQHLRSVTVLFTDVVDSTVLSRRLDPEDVHAVMDGALHRLTAIVESHGGRVLQYAGDSLLAAFGSVEAREDDPERAVRAGLAILEEAKRLAAQVRARHGYGGFDMRAGIHTGAVLLGGGVDADGTIRGIAVNIAARMEQTAPAGGLRISHTTYRHVRGAFDVAEDPPILVKGIPDPLRSYVVLGARARTFGATGRGVDGIETPLIGRDVELARLIDAFEAVRTQGTLALVTLVGDAGLGKTRLMSEFERWLDSRPEAAWRFHGRAQPYGASVPYGLLRALLGWRFGILDHDSQAAAHAKLAQSLAPLLGDRAEAGIALVGQLIGLDYSGSPHVAGIAGDGRQLRERAFGALTGYFRRLLQDGRGLGVVLLDDVHWADDGSLDFVEHLTQACRDLPLLVLCLARPALDEQRPGWGNGARDHERIELGPLSPRSSQELVESLLRRLDPLPAALRDLVTGNAEGNPYFIEELVAMLIDEGVVVTGAGRWQVATDKLVDAHIPSTLAGVLQARLDGLPPAEKTALQQASVIGHVFWDEPLQRLAPDPRALEGLLRRDLIRAREPSSFDGTREYAFKHHLLHQVTYDSVLRDDKRRQHRLTAEWLVARSGERSGERYGLIAEHYERAADAASAAAYWGKAGEAAAGTYLTAAAVSYFGRALDLTPAGESALRYELIKNRIHMLNLAGRRHEEESQVAELEQLAERMNDDAKRAGAASLRARVAIVSGQYRDAASSAARAVALAEKCGETGVALLARSVWASALRSAGDLAGAGVLAGELLRTARAAGNDRRAIDALHLQGDLAARAGRFGAARAYYAQALELARAILDKLFESVQLGNLGEVERAVGNYGVAIEHCEVGLELGRAVGAAMNCVHCVIELAEVANACGDSAAALARVSEGRVIARELSRADIEAWLIVLQGDAQLALGNPVDASSSYREALSMYGEHGDVKVPLEPFAGLALAAAALGRVDEALAHVARVEAGIDAGEAPNAAPGLLWACHEVLAAAGSPRAHEVLGRARALLTERAALLDEADRASFLGNVPCHRAIVAAGGAP